MKNARCWRRSTASSTSSSACEQVDTRGVEPLYTPLSALSEVALRLRDDAVTEGDERERNQRSAPQVEDGLYLVPRVIE